MMMSALPVRMHTAGKREHGATEPLCERGYGNGAGGLGQPDQVWLLWDRRDGQHLLAGIYTDPATARTAIPDWHWYQVADDPVWYAWSGQVRLVPARLNTPLSP